MPFDYTVRIGYADVDRMGFVHHSRYLVFMESARTEMLRATGETYREWEERGVLMPVIESHLIYHKPALYDDILRVETRLVELSRLRLRFEYRIHCDERGIHIASTMTGHVFMNKEGRPIRAGQDVLDRLKVEPSALRP